MPRRLGNRRVSCGYGQALHSRVQLLLLAPGPDTTTDRGHNADAAARYPDTDTASSRHPDPLRLAARTRWSMSDPDTYSNEAGDSGRDANTNADEDADDATRHNRYTHAEANAASRARRLRRGTALLPIQSRLRSAASRVPGRVGLRSPLHVSS
jgi:hypothetical protein